MNSPAHHSRPIERRGLMFVISSPSGAGKTSLARKLIENDPDIAMSVSMTTRPPRPGEIDGQDYIFVSEDKFNEALEKGALLEWARVFDNLYGTPRREVEDRLKNGKDVIFDIDWQGTQQLHEKAGQDVVRVFILPPSVRALEQRLKKRGQDDDEVVRRRMSDAANQISHWAEYDYVIINENLDKSLNELATVLHAERLKRERRIGLSSFVQGMIPELG